MHFAVLLVLLILQFKFKFDLICFKLPSSYINYHVTLTVEAGELIPCYFGRPIFFGPTHSFVYFTI